MSLKERAIYQLPNGRELVAHLTRQNKTVLYNLSASDLGEYEVNTDGRLMFNGQLTAWATNDLLDTGRVASPEVTTRLISSSPFEPDFTHEQNL